MTSVWVVRSEYGTYSPHFLKGGYAAAGWLREHNLTVSTSREAVVDLFKVEHPDQKPSRAGANAGQLATFVLDISPGDYVITPRFRYRVA